MLKDEEGSKKESIDRDFFFICDEEGFFLADVVLMFILEIKDEIEGVTGSGFQSCTKFPGETCIKFISVCALRGPFPS